MSSPRIAFLDGFRGLAILSVVLYHAYGATFADALPFGGRYAMVLPVRFGWLGLLLFFMVSGFVILMTLETCSGFFEFIKRRWLRLFPAMLLASALIFSFDKLFEAGPCADRSALDLLPGLLFLSPALLHALTGLTTESLDGPFWSLYVEVTFYLVFGLAYFWRGARFAIASIFALFVFSDVVIMLPPSGVGIVDKIKDAIGWIGFVHFGWFASGALFYRAYRSGERRPLVLALAVGLLAAVRTRAVGADWVQHVATSSVPLLFALALLSPLARSWLASRPLLFVGFVSYPLYLLHSNIMIGSMQMLARVTPPSVQVALPLLPFVGLVALAWLSARFGEPAVRAALRRPR